MPQISLEHNSRLSLRIASNAKSLVLRAAALQHTDVTNFVTKAVVAEAQKVIEEHERIVLSTKDRDLLFALLDNPPAPNEKLMAAAQAMPML
jgi:uncharacterized protein (DUF1778 family)